VTAKSRVGLFDGAQIKSAIARPPRSAPHITLEALRGSIGSSRS
jgi:hypothetical protein